MANSSSKGSLSRMVDLTLPKRERAAKIATITGKCERITDDQAEKITKLLKKHPGNRKGCTEFLDVLFCKHHDLWSALFFEFRYEQPCNIPRMIAAFTKDGCAICGRYTTRSEVCGRCHELKPDLAHRTMFEVRTKNRKQITKEEFKVIIAKRRSTNLVRYGATHACKNADVKAKLMQSLSKVDWTKARTKAAKTSIAKYGVSSPMQHSAISAKVSKALRAKTADKVNVINKKRADTYNQRTGYRSPRQNPEVLEKSKATYLNRTGYDHNMRDPEFISKLRARHKDKYGVEHPSQRAEVKAKIISTHQAKFGGVGFGSTDVRARIEATNLKRYGFKVPSANPEIMDKCKATWLKIYGFENPNKNPVQALKGLRSSFRTVQFEIGGKTLTVQGKAEAKLARALVSKFGVKNVITQFDSKFPIDKCEQLGWKPDFWIKSLKRFVECKSSWTLMMPHAVDVNRNKAASAGKQVVWIVQMGDKPIRLPTSWWKVPNLDSMLTRLYCERVGKDAYCKPFMDSLVAWLGDAEIKVKNQTVIVDKRVAIEFVPHFWSVKDYMLERKKHLESKGLEVVFLSENVLRKRRAAARSFVRNIAGADKERIHARDTEVKVSKITDEVKQFLDRNHVQGSTRRGTAYCLYRGNSIKAVMVFDCTVSQRGSAKKAGEFELTRYATSCRVPGGASKLLTSFCRTEHPKYIISYSDTTVFSGGMYKTLGFELVSERKQDYYAWFGGLDLRPKQDFSRAALARRWPDHFCEDLTERQNCDLLGLQPVWTLGKKKWVLTL